MKQIFTLLIFSFSIHSVLKSQTVTDTDGNVYNTIGIGTQLWMKENLKTTKYRDGSSIPNVTVNNTWGSLTTGAYCDYSNLPSNANTWGRLYNWYAVSDTRELCPTGWHVPSDYDWSILENYLLVNGFNYDSTTTGGFKIAKALASTTQWLASTVVGASGNTDYPTKRNITQFTALPGGFRYGTNGTFGEMGSSGYWWASTTATMADARRIQYNNSFFTHPFGDWDVGFSVRCICDLPTNIEGFNNSNKIILYPNPTMDYVIIEGLENKNTIEIVNLQGQIVKNLTVSSTKTTIDITALSIGIYTVKIKSDKGIFVKKLIKQ